jgi:hypothetical protein
MSSAARHALRAVVCALSPLALLALIAPRCRLGDLAAALLSFASATAAVTTAGVLAPHTVLVRPRNALVAVLLGTALSLAATKLPPVLGSLLGAFGLLTAACALGIQVGSRVESPGHILPVALLSAGVDLWSVTAASGPTHVIVHTPALLQLLTVRAVVPPTRDPIPQIGFGDVVFTSLYVAIARRHGLSSARTITAVALGIFTAGLVAAALEAPVPALPTLGLAMVLAHPAARRVPARDRRATLVAASVLVLSLLRVLHAMVRIAR